MTNGKPGPANLRSDIGVRNPYALAEVILRKNGTIKDPIEWRKLKEADAKSYLYKAFKLNYSQLFDPKYGSPIFRGPREVARESAPSGKEFLFPQNTEASPCTAVVSSWTTLPGWNWPAPPPCSTPGQYGIDTMQGCAPDCYFIAALSSIAWTCPVNLTGIPDTSTPPLQKYKFVNATTGAVSGLKVARPLAVDVNGNLVFARPTDNVSVWSGLYEKAYAIFKGIQPASAPDITQLNQGNPTTTLFEILGKTINTQIIQGADPVALFNAINAMCGGSSTGSQTGSPMVAWTYPNSTLTPDGDQYTDDLIVANHSYSILGTGIVDNLPCVVLRNPFGFSLGNPAEAGIAAWNCSPWSPASDLSTSTPGSPAVNPSNGNFAMDMDAFIRFFQGFGYTT